MTRRLPIPLLPAWDDRTPFPPVEQALEYPNGLLAAGGSLRPERLLRAYRSGIFPWYAEGEPILWWSPDPRCVLFPEELYVSKRLARKVRQRRFEITRDTAFRQVMEGCQAPRADAWGTWILPETIDAFAHLHELGYATSFECWLEGMLVGGVYGVHIGRVFFGESMFSQRTDASKITLVHVARAKDIDMIDCQITNPHLERLGARQIPRARFIELLREHGVPPA